MIIKVIIIAFVAFVLWRTFIRFRKSEITIQEVVIWSVFWLLVVGVTLVPQQTDTISQYLGVERGADLLVYLSVITLFFLVFRIIVKLEKIDKDITKVVRNTALTDNNGNNDKHDT